MRLLPTVVTALVLGAVSLPAQQEAEQAFRDGKAAFAAERFAEARDRFALAARTDGDNPEVSLWLGRACYALGDLDGALAAWKRALELAPDEPFCRRMVAALTGRDLDAEQRLRLAEDLLEAGLRDAARSACRAIGETVVLDAAQRARLRLLTARVALERGEAQEAMGELRALLVDDPNLDSRPDVQLLLGRAEVRLGGEQTARGLARLARIAAAHPDDPAGIGSALELLRHAVGTRDDAGDRTSLQAWIDAHGDDPRIVDARRILLHALLRAGSIDAVRLAVSLWPSIDVHERSELTGRLRALIASRQADAPAAAIAALGELRALGLGPDAERDVARDVAVLHVSLALARVGAAVRAGSPLDGEPEAAMTAALASLDELRALDPGDRARSERLAFAAKLRALAAPGAGGDLHPCDRRAVELALAVARDAPAEVAAKDLVCGVAAAAASQGLAGLRTAARVLADLAAVLGPESAFASWSDVQRRRLATLEALAQAELTDALARGAGVAPREPTDAQRALVAVAIELVRRDRSAAAETIALVARHAATFAAQDRVDLAAELVDSVARGLPANEAPAARAAAIGLRIDAVLGPRDRRNAAGLAVPAELDPGLQQALAELCALESACTPAQLATVRGLRARVVDHFRALEQFAVAEQVLIVRATPASDGAEAWAELRLAHLRNELAVRELRRIAPEDGPPELTPSFRAALDAYFAFVARRSTSDLAGEAVDALLGIASRFEQAGGRAAAIEVYRETAAKLAALTAPAELRKQRAAEAAFAAAAAADAHARATLEARPGRPIDDATWRAIDVALDAWAEFVTAHADSALAAQVLPRELDLGVAIARGRAWGAAERVFGRVGENGVQRADQVAFCRALCMLGPVLGDGALAMLATAIAPSPAPATRSGPATAGAVAAIPDAPAAADMFSVGFTRAVSERNLAADSEQLLQTVRQLEHQRAQAVAALRGRVDQGIVPQGRQPPHDDELTAAEVERIRAVFDRAYPALLELRRAYPFGAYQQPARHVTRAMIDHWRASMRWAEAAALAERFLGDEPRDADRDELRLGIARDLATFAGRLPAERGPAHAMLRTIGERFDRARAAFDVLIAAGGAREPATVRTARWESAATFLAQARTIASLRPSLARGRFARAARELADVAAAHPEHPEAATVPEQLWAIGDELIALGFHDEAAGVRRELWVRYPMHALADRAALSIAELYRGPLGQPLRAAELLQELNFARGGGDLSLQEAILAVGLELHAARRWVEALHVLESFVDSFPRHPRAGEALTQIGQVHQSNGAYEDAIAAYRRVIAEYPTGEHVSAARWAIAECWIHQSEWRRAMDGYVAFQTQYPKDGRVAEAARRVEVLKDLVRFQQVVDEVGQRKAFDAQFQIGAIVRDRLGLPQKAIVEFGKVPARWPDSHLADDALFEVGRTWLTSGETTDARVALLQLAERYPESPLADDALYLVGKSFEDEADRLVAVTRAESAKDAQEQAQGMAYARAQENVRRFRDEGARRVAQLKGEGKLAQAEEAEASLQATSGAFRVANTQVFAQWATNEAEALTAAQLADREDRIRAALRQAVGSYAGAARVAGGDKAGEALLRMARIYDARLEDSEAAMATWLEIVRQFSGTAVAEDASWRIAQFHDRHDDPHAAIESYQAFLRNYRRSTNAGTAQAAIAENHEKLGEWVQAMDAYTNYINNFPDGPLVERAREQIAWIKTYRL